MEGSSKKATPPRSVLTSPPRSAVVKGSPKSNLHPVTVLATPVKASAESLQSASGATVPDAGVTKSGSVALKSKKRDDANRKPDCSYNCLIGMTLLASGSLPVCEIYRYIEQEFPYFKNSAPEGWKNSVRHSLSLGQYFRKAGNNLPLERQKGFHWEIIPEKKEVLQKEVQQFLVYNGRSLSRHQPLQPLQMLKPCKPEERTPPRSTPRKKSEPAPRFTTPRKNVPPGMQPPPPYPATMPAAYVPPMNFIPGPQRFPPQGFQPPSYPPPTYPTPPAGNFFYGVYPPQAMQPAYAAPFAYASGFLPMAAPIPCYNSQRPPPNAPASTYTQPNKPCAKPAASQQNNVSASTMETKPTGPVPKTPPPTEQTPSESTKMQNTSDSSCRQPSPQEPPPDSTSLDMDVDMLTAEDLQRYLDSALTNELLGERRDSLAEAQDDNFGMDIEDLLEALDKAENTIRQASICHNLEAPQSPKFSLYAENNQTKPVDWQYMMSTKQGSGKLQDPCLQKF